MKKIAKKIGIFGGIAVLGGLCVTTAIATFLVSQVISSSNTVTAESASLSIIATSISLNGLAIGGSTSPNALTIKNAGNATGDLQIQITSAGGQDCQFMTLSISGTASGSATIAQGNSIDLGTLAGGANDTLSQVVSLNNSGILGQSCGWSETATLSGN